MNTERASASEPGLTGHVGVADAGHLLDHAHDLIAVSGLVVVPDVEDAAGAVQNGGLRIDDTGAVGADDVTRDDLVAGGEVDLVAQRRIERQFTKIGVQLVGFGGAAQLQIEDGQRELVDIKRFDTRRDIPGYVKKDYFGPMVEDYLRQGGGKRGRVGKATSYILDAQEFKQFGVFWLESNLPSVKA